MGSFDTTDPVCGMTVDPASARHSTEYRDTTYYFCSEGCRKRFEAAPENFLGSDGEAGHRHEHHAAPEVAKVTAGEYTCPMHPDQKQAHPG
ncbi:MAG: YHS domain-containing protein, partial [Deinococcales bacterium]